MTGKFKNFISTVFIYALQRSHEKMVTFWWITHMTNSVCRSIPKKKEKVWFSSFSNEHYSVRQKGCGNCRLESVQVRRKEGALVQMPLPRGRLIYQRKICESWMVDHHFCHLCECKYFYRKYQKNYSKGEIALKLWKLSHLL